MMDTDQCIQRLIRKEPEGSDHAQHKIEDTAQYWVMKEKEAATNYCCDIAPPMYTCIHPTPQYI